MKNGKKIAISALVAGAVGYAAGVLTAPKSGKETRKDIQKAALAAKTTAERELKKLHSDLTDLLAKTRDKAQGLSAKAKAEYDKAVQAAKDSKEKVRQLLSALHDGGVEDKELQQAIKEASKALTHLKVYLKK